MFEKLAKQFEQDVTMRYQQKLAEMEKDAISAEKYLRALKNRSNWYYNLGDFMMGRGELGPAELVADKLINNNTKMQKALDVLKNRYPEVSQSTINRMRAPFIGWDKSGIENLPSEFLKSRAIDLR